MTSEPAPTDDQINDPAAPNDPPAAPNPDPERDDTLSEGGSSYGTTETSGGGADAVPDDPDINVSQGGGGSGPGGGDGPGAGLSAPENNNG